MITVIEIIMLSSVFEVHRSRFKGGALQVSLTNFWALIYDGLPGGVTRSFRRGSATEPARWSTSVESSCVVR